MASEDKSKVAEVPLFPTLEIFGGAYGILIIVLVIMILLQRQVAEKMNDPTQIGGISDTAMGGNVGLVISLLPDKLKIERTQEIVTLEELQKEANAFRSFAKAYFGQGSNTRPLFFVYPGCNNVFLQVERILAELNIRFFNQLIINKEMVARLKEINESEAKQK